MPKPKLEFAVGDPRRYSCACGRKAALYKNAQWVCARCHEWEKYYYTKNMRKADLDRSTPDSLAIRKYYVAYQLNGLGV